MSIDNDKLNKETQDKEKVYSFSLQSDNNNETNLILTSKYTWFNVIPKILFEQFSKKIHLYFIIICCIECIKYVSLTSGYPLELIPLSFVILINGIKDFLEDYKKKAFDNKENTREVFIFNHLNKAFEKKLAQDIKVGDIIKVYNEEFFPVDLILVSSQRDPNDNNMNINEDEIGVCYYESKNIDGETNLKFKQAHHDLAKRFRIDDEIINLKGFINCSPPNEFLNEFLGRFYENPQDLNNFIQLDKQCLLLKGCKLKQTYSIIGIAVYIGHNTKLLKNYPIHKNKVATIETKLNSQVFYLLLIDLIVCSLVSISDFWIGKDFSKVLYPNKIEIAITDPTEKVETVFSKLLINLGTLFLFMTNIIPISLLVSLEIIKYIQGIFISWDIKLADKETYKYPIVQSSTLNEDLGQVGFIFSDKTGTLTKNIMTFKKLSVGGISYGEDYYEKSLIKLNDKYGKVTNFNFYDNEFINHLRDDDNPNYKNIKYFLLCVCLCNTIFTEIKESNGKTDIVFQGTSPDEIALINAARYFQYMFVKRESGNKIILDIFGVTHEYTINYFLDYTSERKCMSVIVKDPDDRYFVFTKGADSVISTRITHNQHLLDTNKEHLIEYAKQGLRTLMMAYKEITIEELNDWETIYNNALLERDRNKIQEAYNNIECDYYLLGCSAIEDQLQDKVPKTIRDFIKVGIKVWVLTGDKRDTSLSIAFACKLITHEFIILDFYNNNSIEDLRISLEEKTKRIEDSPNEKYALVVSTEELELMMSDEDLTNKFYEVSVRCNSVLCCRVSPKQKAQMVELIKTRQKDTITLAIGDGANDVNMISTAHIGIGIIGREGLQAAKISDYAIAQFHYLRRLLFVHGRECYRKNSFVVIYTLYKNIIVIVPQIAYCYFSMFSAVYLYDPFLFNSYNIIFTAFPIIWYAIADKEFKYRILENEPKYYIQGIVGTKFTIGRFWKWILYGMLQGLAILLMFCEVNNHISSNGSTQDMLNLGLFTFLSCILIVNTKIIFYFNSCTGIEYITIIISILSFYLMTIPLSLISDSIFSQNIVENITSGVYYLSVYGVAMFIVLIDVGTKYLSLYFGFTKSTDSFANEFELVQTLEDETKKELKNNEEERFFQNFYLGSAFSQETGQARHFAKKLVIDS